MSIVKPTRPPRHGTAANPRSFTAAYTWVTRHPKLTYHTSGNGTPFRVTAQTATRGRHRDEKVLIFRTLEGVERARAYQDCWGHKTNCNRTWIDCYTQQI
ncbi:MAG: hypothetical protein M0038_14015 [Pseudomonadota bacterium]|jgi:hypothetical protein|nr:hypothetical protein [Pseudomonadota bacterium]